MTELFKRKQYLFLFKTRTFWIYVYLIIASLFIIALFSNNLSSARGDIIGFSHDEIFGYAHIETDENEQFPNEIILVLDGVGIGNHLFENGKEPYSKICINTILAKYGQYFTEYRQYLFENTKENGYGENSTKCLFYEKDIANDPKISGVSSLISLEEDRYHFVPDLHKYYYYPFDTISFGIKSYITLDFFASDNTVAKSVTLLAPIQLEYNLSSWEVTTGEEVSTFELHRHRVLRLLTIILTIGLLLIPLLIISSSNSNDAVNITLVAIFGAWGVRQIIIPNNNVSEKLFDLFILGEYVLIILSLLVFLFFLKDHQNTNSSRRKLTLKRNRNK